MSHSFGSFELERLLGRGGMAEAYLAHRPGSDTPIVLKRIRADHASNEEYLKRFVLEAQVASRLDHPCLVRFEEFGRVGECQYLAMQMVRGWSLHRLLHAVSEADDGTVPVPIGLALGQNLLDGLGCMHAVVDEGGHPRPMLHRDVTPSNVIVSREGIATLIDYGITKDMLGPSLTLPGRVIGTVRYMAPEHRRAEFADARADVFSASVVLFELLFGRSPWPPLKSLKELLRTTFDPPLISDHEREQVSDGVVEVVFRGLACESKDRFADAGEMSQALRAVQAKPAEAEEIVAWCKSLALTMDEDMDQPVMDLGDGTDGVRWTSTGTLISAGSATLDIEADPMVTVSKPMELPPLPPRRGGTLTHDVEVMMQEALGPARWLPWVLAGGGLGVLVAVGLLLASRAGAG